MLTIRITILSVCMFLGGAAVSHATGRRQVVLLAVYFVIFLVNALAIYLYDRAGR